MLFQKKTITSKNPISEKMDSDNNNSTGTVKKDLASLSFSGSLLILAIGIFATVGVLAWFSSNNTVSSNASNVTADVTKNLIIGTSASDVTNQKYFSESNKKITFSNEALTLTPATHTDDTTHFSTRLKVLDLAKSSSDLANGIANGINVTTGLPGTSAVFKNAEANTNFVDYVFYISASGHDYEYDSVSVTFSTTADLTNDSFLNAATVDFYIKKLDGSAQTYVGKLSLKDTEPLTLMEGPGVFQYQEATAPVEITARCYFDGSATTSDGTKALIQTSTVSTTALSFSIMVSADISE